MARRNELYQGHGISKHINSASALNYTLLYGPVQFSDIAEWCGHCQCSITLLGRAGFNWQRYRVRKKLRPPGVLTVFLYYIASWNDRMACLQWSISPQ